MKKLALSLLSISLLAGSVFAGDGKGKNSKDSEKTYVVDTEASKIFWTGKKVTGEHTGELMVREGKLSASGENISKGTLVLNMNSITVTDVKDAEMNKKLVGHLKSDDFFSVAKFPEGRFELAKITPIENAKEGEPNYNVIGKLTLKGITNEITFPATITMKNDKLVAQGKAEFDRAKYDIRYGSGSYFEGLGDNLIYDKVELNFVLSAKAQ